MGNAVQGISRSANPEPGKGESNQMYPSAELEKFREGRRNFKSPTDRPFNSPRSTPTLCGCLPCAAVQFNAWPIMTVCMLMMVHAGARHTTRSLAFQCMPVRVGASRCMWMPVTGCWRLSTHADARRRMSLPCGGCDCMYTRVSARLGGSMHVHACCCTSLRVSTFLCMYVHACACACTLMRAQA